MYTEHLTSVTLFYGLLLYRNNSVMQRNLMEEREKNTTILDIFDLLVFFFVFLYFGSLLSF